MPRWKAFACLTMQQTGRSRRFALSLIKRYYKIDTSTTTVSFHFRLCHQKLAEHLVDFWNRLKCAAVPCEFGSHLDRALKDQFVASLASQVLVQKILIFPGSEIKSFEDVIQIAEREERTIMHSNHWLLHKEPLPSLQPLKSWTRFHSENFTSH